MARTQAPPPLPPETRTVGQLVAESIRLYGARFWPSLALGIGPGLLGIAAADLHGAVRVVVVVGAGPLVLASSYAGAVALVRPIGRGRYVAVALAVGYVAFLPICVSRLWIFPGIYLVALGWLALVGLAVPAALVERRGYADALRRGIQLARADYVHALGSLATLAITIFLTGLVIFFSIREGSGQAIRIAAVLALVVLAPLFVLGAAVLYVDQAARVESSPRPRRSSNGDLHSSFQPDCPGSADVEGEPRTSARGEQGR
ncbi:MAG TPA: hypothetical protein VLB89_06290 [Gaiellaceae bacterium]|nr:hypothetical protein [Gaiellaceae bacterium]